MVRSLVKQWYREVHTETHAAVLMAVAFGYAAWDQKYEDRSKLLVGACEAKDVDQVKMFHDHAQDFNREL